MNLDKGSIIVKQGGHYLLGQNPIKTHKKWVNTSSPLAGYLAYPNPNLKNDIPNALFYEYEKLSKIKLPKASCKTQKGKPQVSVTKAQYIQKIKQIKNLLKAGEIYQLNYAIRFQLPFNGDPLALFLRLQDTNPSNHTAYLNAGDFQIISTSPERLFKIEKNIITTEPIKGTISKQGGKKNLDYLLNSEKERAELDMITDLYRNDIGKVAKYGSLKLTKEREVLELPNLWHCYSQVQGVLSSNTTTSQVLQALFPGGSITGCPKIRAMKYIEELENLPRNIFTGSIGFQHKGITDFNIAIRTALVKNGMLEYWAGSGIVADSDPEKEYEECLLKAEKFLNLL